MRQLKARAADGCQLHVRVLREGRGAPVLFVHALAMDASLWGDVARHMSEGPPLVALDCRGHGLSGRPAGPYSTGQFAEDLIAVLDAIGASRAHVVGCSMGGTIALALAGKHPARVASLTVIDATACYGTDVATAWEARGMRPAQHGFASMLDFQLGRWFSDDFIAARPPALEQAVRVFLANDASAYLECCRMLGRADERPALSNYGGPALVLVGQEDYATPPDMAEEIVSLLPGATLQVLEGLRHFTPIEAPEKVARQIEKLLAGIS